MMMHNHRLLNVYVNYLEIFDSCTQWKTLLDLYKILVDAELLYNLSSLANCDNLHLLRSDLSNMVLIHVLHPHVIYFFACWFYIFWNVLLKWCISNTYFPINCSCANKTPSEIGNIISMCSSHIEIWGR